MRVAWFIDNLTGNSMVFGLIKLLLQKMKLWLMMNLKVTMFDSKFSAFNEEKWGDDRIGSS